MTLYRSILIFKKYAFIGLISLFWLINSMGDFLHSAEHLSTSVIGFQANSKQTHSSTQDKFCLKCVLFHQIHQSILIQNNLLKTYVYIPIQIAIDDFIYFKITLIQTHNRDPPFIYFI